MGWCVPSLQQNARPSSRGDGRFMAAGYSGNGLGGQGARGLEPGNKCSYIKTPAVGGWPLDFEWDEAKSEITRRRRGFGFEIAFDFDWEKATIREDRRRDYGEVRFQAFGYARSRRVYIAFTMRRPRTRIISVRLMHEKEAKRYDH